jgi:excisionase family DNA binding protein
MTHSQLANDRRGSAPHVPSNANGRGAQVIPFAERISCTIDEACNATGLGRTKLYELIATDKLTTTTVGRRRLIMVRSLFALLDQTKAL